MLPKRVPIPETFYSIETGEPIDSCLMCEKSLLDDGTEYLIEKGYRGYEAYDVEETVFGYAMCMECHHRVRRSFSDLSMRRCQSYFAGAIDVRRRAKALLDAESVNPSRWTDHCVVHDTPREELDEYQLLAHCQGDELLLTHLPILLGGTAVDDLTDRLSSETIDELGGFRDEYFDAPPDLERDLQGPVLA